MSPHQAGRLAGGSLVYGQLGSMSNNYVTSDGMSTTDGQTVRTHVGRLDGFTGGVDEFGLLVKTGILGTGTNTTIDDSGIGVSDGSVERVRLGALGGGDYGLKVVNAGSTVIIDGTSNMFKIVASGTLTHSQGANSSGASQTVLTGVGLPSAQSPAFVAYLTEGTTPANNANRYAGFFFKPRGVIPVFAASTSGGATNTNIIGELWTAEAFSGVDGSNNPAINLAINNASGGSVGAYMRWHALKEAAV